MSHHDHCIRLYLVGGVVGDVGWFHRYAGRCNGSTHSAYGHADVGGSFVLYLEDLVDWKKCVNGNFYQKVLKHKIKYGLFEWYKRLGREWLGRFLVIGGWEIKDFFLDKKCYLVCLVASNGYRRREIITYKKTKKDFL